MPEPQLLQFASLGVEQGDALVPGVQIHANQCHMRASFSATSSDPVFADAITQLEGPSHEIEN
jgi:hypothetical protein